MGKISEAIKKRGIMDDFEKMIKDMKQEAAISTTLKSRFMDGVRNISPEDRLIELRSGCDMLEEAFENHNESICMEAILALAAETGKTDPLKTLDCLGYAVAQLEMFEAAISPMFIEIEPGDEIPHTEDLRKIEVEKGRIARAILEIVPQIAITHPDEALNALERASVDCMDVQHTLANNYAGEPFWGGEPFAANPEVMQQVIDAVTRIVHEQLDLEKPTIDFIKARNEISVMASRLEDVNSRGEKVLIKGGEEMLVTLKEVIDRIENESPRKKLCLYAGQRTGAVCRGA